jgi:hypothetical protein
MSHMAAIDLEVTDLAALKAAAEYLGLTFMEGQTTWRWFGRWMRDYNDQDAAFVQGIKPEEYGKCADHVLTIAGNKSAYEVGVVRRRDGKPGWILLYDFWGPGQALVNLLQGVDKDGKYDRVGKLKQAYVACKSRPQLEAKGFDCRIITTKTNHVQCVGRRLKRR